MTSDRLVAAVFVGFFKLIEVLANMQINSLASCLETRPTELYQF